MRRRGRAPRTKRVYKRARPYSHDERGRDAPVIVIYIEHFEDFLKFFPRRLTNEIFYEVRSPNPELANGYHVLFHFLGHVGEQLTGIYETEIEIQLVRNRDELIARMRAMFAEYELDLIEGKIREIYLSLS